MNTYEVKWFNFYHGKFFSKIVIAKNEMGANKLADCPVENPFIEIVEEGKKPTVDIIDAEELLYEMDANESNAITVMENGKKTTYSRKQVTESLNL